MNLFERFESVASQQPDRVALQIKEEAGYRRLTYGEVAGHARSLGAALTRAGIRRGDRVALLSENRPEWTVAYFAAIAAGATNVPLDVQWSEGEIANVLGHAGCRVAIASGRQALRLQGLISGESALRYVVDLDAERSGGQTLAYRTLLQGRWGSADSLPAVGPDDLASILYTSGTTGTPKGVMLSHGNLLANAQSVLDFGLVTPADNFIALLPLHHSFPFMLQLIVLYTGATLTFSPSLRGPELLACMQETAVTILVGVPQIYYLLHTAIFDEFGRRPLLVRLLLTGLLGLSGALRARGINLGGLLFAPVRRKLSPRIRILVSGGARLDPAIAEDFLRLGFTLTEGYGLTETSPVVAFNPLNRMRPGTVGTPLPGVEVRIHQADAEGVGEILVRGPNVMQGYFENPEATAEVLQDGWLRTGDLGYVDSEGYLTITGRAKEVIVLSSGKNIYPEEVEQEYLKSPYIQEICLLPQTAARGGAAVEGLVALVLPNVDYFRAKGMTNIFETIRWDMENVGRNLPPYKRPTNLHIVKEAFPRTRLGKIQRHLVRERYQAEVWEEPSTPEAPPPSEPDLALLEDEAGRRLLDYLRGVTQKPAIGLDDNLELDLGLDSLARVQMLASLEGMLNVQIPDEAAAECFTVREVVDKLRTLRGAPGGPVPAARHRSWRDILLASPPADVEAMIERSSRPGAVLVGAVSRGICIATFRTFYRLRVEGLSNLPQHGPLILVSNHCSYFDAFILAAAVPHVVAYQVFYLGFESFFRHSILAWWGRGVHVIPVDMGNYLVRALQASTLILQRGKMLCIFPEGERSADGSVRPFRKGAGILARELGVPILPAHIAGSFRAWPRGQALPRISPIRVRFGPPVTPETLLGEEGPSGADDFETITMRLRARVIALGEEERRPTTGSL